MTAENRANTPDSPPMSVDEIVAAIHGQTSPPYQPEGGSDVQPLSPLGLDKTAPEAAPPNVTAQQGAGGGYLYPGAQGEASDGAVHVGGNAPDSSGGPPQLPAVSNVVGALTGDGSQYHGQPEGGTNPGAASVGRPDTALGRDQGQGQGINPMLKPANAPKAGPFGKPGF